MAVQPSPNLSRVTREAWRHVENDKQRRMFNADADLKAARRNHRAALLEVQRAKEKLEAGKGFGLKANVRFALSHARSTKAALKDAEAAWRDAFEEEPPEHY